jgi:hypothetical protein
VCGCDAYDETGNGDDAIVGAEDSRAQPTNPFGSMSLAMTLH